ncbi:MAG: pteridine reductase [Woeseiaceae bacterium]
MDIVLHVAYKVFMNVILQQGKEIVMADKDLKGKVVLVTGAARRIGAAIVTRLHDNGATVAIHYRSSAQDADGLAARLNKMRSDSAATFKADLLDTAQIDQLISRVCAWHGRLDGLVNNASTFYPTPVGSITEAHWEDLMGSNLKAPLFLSQAAAPELAKRNGCIVNIVDIHSQRPLRNHAVYGPAKAGLAMLTRSLAKDLAPKIRVNGVSPGAILWPEDGMSDAAQQSILRQVPLQRPGEPDDIAACVLYLFRDAGYVTGQIIAVDGGRSVS